MGRGGKQRRYPKWYRGEEGTKLSGDEICRIWLGIRSTGLGIRKVKDVVGLGWVEGHL